MSVEITNIDFREIKKGKVLAQARVELNDVLELSCLVVEGREGPFLSMPRVKANDGKYYNQAYIKDENNRFDIQDEAIRRFNAFSQGNGADAGNDTSLDDDSSPF